MRVPRRTRVAQAVYWFGGKLSRIKTPRKTYRLEMADGDFKTTPIPGRRWLPSQTSIKLLQLSLRIDPKHWDHWALVHGDCETLYCEVCQNFYCPDVEDE